MTRFSKVRMTALSVAICGMAALAWGAHSSPALAAEEIPEPNEPLAKAAFDVLKKHCARCHQDGLLEKRDRPASNFGNVLLMHEMAADTRFVIPGNPDASELVKRVADPIRADMPYDVKNAELTGETTDYPTPTADELNALRDWVVSLKETAVAECGDEKMMSNKDIVQAIVDDLDSQPEHLIKTTRYITLTNLKNACVPEKKMEVYRQAVVKLLNSLSMNPEVLRLQTIDEAGHDHSVQSARPQVDRQGLGADSEGLSLRIQARRQGLQAPAVRDGHHSALYTRRLVRLRGIAPAAVLRPAEASQDL